MIEAKKEFILSQAEALKYQLAELDIKLAMKYDLDHRFWLRIERFLDKSYKLKEEPLEKQSLPEKRVSQATKVLKEVIGDIIHFKVIEADFNKRNQNVMNVCFSECTDVEEILKVLVHHCRINPQRLDPPKVANRIVQNTTRVRLSILTSIGEKVLKDRLLVVLSCQVMCVNSAPILSVVFKNDTVNTKFDFSYIEAVSYFNSLMLPEDFKTAYDLCKSQCVPKDKMHIFAVTFPKENPQLKLS